MRTAEPVDLQQPPSYPRLLAGADPEGRPVALSDHLIRWGAPPTATAGRSLIEEVEASGLAGRGGAWFPVAAKWRSVCGGRRRPVVVVNGAEGEPASGKDALLIARSPHLVLDGASLAAAAVSATRLVVYVPSRLAPAVQAAVAERRRRALDPLEIEVVTAPDRFLAGQESAVVNVVNGGGPVPTFIGLQPVRDRGVGGRPTLVQNAETLAHVALIARFGASWFRQCGTSTSPGTLLLTVTGRWARPEIVEAPLGATLRRLLDLTDDHLDHYQGVLLGGYGGTWLDVRTAMDVPLAVADLRAQGASLGAGVVVLLPRSQCALSEVAQMVRYLQRQGAGQCGPCVHGLSELAGRWTSLAHHPDRNGGEVETIRALCASMEGRGACRHPDGVAHMARSALRVFGDEVVRHQRSGPCASASSRTCLPGVEETVRVSRRVRSR